MIIQNWSYSLYIEYYKRIRVDVWVQRVRVIKCQIINLRDETKNREISVSVECWCADVVTGENFVIILH
jgi:hypothetical protein